MASFTDSVMQIASSQQVAIGASSAQSAVIIGDGAFAIVCLNPTVNCHIAVGTNPTATTTWTAGDLKFRLIANQNFSLKINSGDRIAVIQESSSGTLNISRMV